MTPARRKTAADLRREAFARQMRTLAKSAEFIIAIDPGSESTGGAIINVKTEELISAARFKANGYDSIQRMRSLSGDIRRWIIDDINGGNVGELPEHIAFAIEVPSHHVNKRGFGQANGVGLPTYGQMVGRVMVLAEQIAHSLDMVLAVDEQTWTRSAQKQARAAAIEARFPQYDRSTDPKLDVADAIGIGVWAAAQINLHRSMSE